MREFLHFIRKLKQQKIKHDFLLLIVMKSFNKPSSMFNSLCGKKNGHNLNGFHS